MKTTFKNSTKKTNSIPKKKWLIIGAGTVAGLLLVLLVLQWTNVINLPFFGNDDNEDETGQVDEINYGPPTEEELTETQDFKDELASNNPTDITTPAPGEVADASVTIASWGQNQNTGAAEVTGYVTGIYEDGGTCTASMEKDGETVTGSRSATRDATTVSCGVISIDKSKLANGTWTLTLSYSSSNAKGTSQPVTLEVK